MSLSGQGWLVTGGTGGIGRAIAAAASEQGAQVLVCARTADPDLPTIVADVGCEDDVERMFDEATERLPSLDVVVNNAGITLDRLLVQTTLDEWNAVLATNLRGPFLVCRRAVGELLGQGGGAIVNVSSFAANGLVGQGAYAAAKAGLLSLTRSIAKEYGRAGIRCNAVVPGFVDTAMTHGMRDRAACEELAALGRFATVDEVAAAVLFLASAEASFVTGDTLYVTGGATDVPRFPRARSQDQR